MVFTRKGEYYSTSEESYTVCATLHNETWKFTAWTPKHGRQAQIISIHDKSEDA